MATRRTQRTLVIGFAGLALLAMLVTGVFNYLLGGDPRVLVVTMEQDADQRDRETLKRDCGSLPGVTVVPDRGDKSPQVQGRFPVRFKIGDATVQQEAALTACVNAHASIVRGVLTEGDR